MRSRNGSEDRYQDDQYRARCERVTQKRESFVSPPAGRSAIMPEPTMAASKNAVPKPSARSLRGRLHVGT